MSDGITTVSRKARAGKYKRAHDPSNIHYIHPQQAQRG